MKLYLIRHGETVDNVAGVYAGIRDSELTRHGWTQAQRLGNYFAEKSVMFTHIFSSDLQRAHNTAGLVLSAQRPRLPPAPVFPTVERLPVLREQDFGDFEGVTFLNKPKGSKLSDHLLGKDTPGVVQPESTGSMERRMDRFLDSYLVPLIKSSEYPEPVVGIVSHGIILQVLWRRLLKRLPAKSVSLHPNASSGTTLMSLEHLGRWGNTGYLELRLNKSPKSSRTSGEAGRSFDGAAYDDRRRSSAKCENYGPTAEAIFTTPSAVPLPPSSQLTGYTLFIRRINGKKHLEGLKRTGGGIGSAKYDTSQKKIDTFFKRKSAS